MKTIVYALAVIGALALGGLIMAGYKSPPVVLSGLSGLCPQMAQQAVRLPEDKAEYLAPLLHAADILNNSGTCVIEGGYGTDSHRFYLAVRDHSGGKPYFKRYTAADLLTLKPQS